MIRTTLPALGALWIGVLTVSVHAAPQATLAKPSDQPPGPAASQPQVAPQQQSTQQQQDTRQRDAWELELEQLAAKAAAVRDMTAHFEQRKHTPLLKKPLVSSGQLRIKGDTMLWETRKPQPTVMHIEQQRLQLYYPQQATVEQYALDSKLASLAASPLPRLAVLREHFTLKPGKADAADPDTVLAVLLEPKLEALREHVDHVLVQVDRKTGLASRVEILDADGDRTVMRFEGIEVNTGLKDEDVALKLPAGTRVASPLGPQQGVQGAKPR